jgi:AGZA family xanthine/uracil permease-like MFS transporter
VIFRFAAVLGAARGLRAAPKAAAKRAEEPRMKRDGKSRPTGSAVDRLFHVHAHSSTVRRELLGGVTTFVAMAYIIVVNPAILSAAGIPPGPSTVATILAAVFGTFLMGLYANRPIAVAPYMGENAFIAFSLALAGVSWQQRLGTVFVSGVAFALLSVLRLRSWLANAVTPSMKHSFAVGIGLFLMLIGLFETGIVAQPAAPGVPLQIGNWHDRRVQLAIGGFIIMMLLMHWRIPGSILLGMVLTGIAGALMGLGEAPSAIVALPWAEEYDLTLIAGQLDVRGVLQLSFLPVLLTLFLVSFLDTLGTLVGLGAVGGMLDDRGNFPQIERPMLVDALSCMFSALVGTSTSGAFLESAAGIREGARTGLAAIVTAFFFAACLFFIPLVQPLQQMKYAYGPALIAVGVLMLGAVAKIDFVDLTEAVPAVATIALMAFTYNVANGLTAGLVLHPLMKLAAGRWRELHPGGVVLAGLCMVYFVFGLPH